MAAHPPFSLSHLHASADRDAARVLRLARLHVALGYAYVLGVIALLLLAAIALLAIDLPGALDYLRVAAVPLVAFAVVIIHALRVRVPRPAGFSIGIAQARALHERIEAIRTRLGAPRPDGVVLTREFNAGVMEAPRFGPFRRPRRYLTIGIPLLCGLTPAQVDAVLAHEFAHFAAGHTGQAFGFYRASVSWQRVMEHMEGTGAWALPVFRRFFGWFVPRLSEYGLALARRYEREADAAAVRVTSAEDFAGALVAMEVRERWYRIDWPRDVWRAAVAAPTIPEAVWTGLPDALRALDTHRTRRMHIGQALREAGAPDDPHPTLHARLVACGAIADGDAMPEAIDRADALLGRLDRTACDALLGDLAPRLLTALDEAWREEVDEAWRAEQAQVEVMRRRLAAIAAIEQEGDTLSEDELRERLDLTMRLDGPAAARETAERLLALAPDDVLARAALGTALLHEEDPAGVAHLRAAIAADIDATPSLVPALAEFFETRRDEEGMREVARLTAAYDASVREGIAERQSVSREDALERIELPEELADAIRSACMRSQWVASVLITRKLVRHRAARPFLVVLIRRTAFGHASPHPPRVLAQAFIDSISEPLPPCLVLLDDAEHDWLVEHLRAKDLAVEISAS